MNPSDVQPIQSERGEAPTPPGEDRRGGDGNRPLAAEASQSDRTQCTAGGMDDYVVKPAETGDLVSAMVRHLRPR